VERPESVVGAAVSLAHALIAGPKGTGPEWVPQLREIVGAGREARVTTVHDPTEKLAEPCCSACCDIEVQGLVAARSRCRFRLTPGGLAEVRP